MVNKERSSRRSIYPCFAPHNGGTPCCFQESSECTRGRDTFALALCAIAQSLSERYGCRQAIAIQIGAAVLSRLGNRATLCYSAWRLLTGSEVRGALPLDRNGRSLQARSLERRGTAASYQLVTNNGAVSERG